MTPFSRRALIVTGAVAVVAAASWKWQRRALPSTILDLRPLDATHVAVIRRDARAAGDTAFEDSYVEQLSATTRAWRQTLPETLDLGAGVSFRDNAVVVGDMLVVRGVYQLGHGERPRLFGLRAEDGAVMWTASPLADGSALSPTSRPAAAALLAAGDRVVSFFSTGQGDAERLLAIAYEAETGREVWRADVPAPLVAQPIWLRANLLLVSSERGVTVFDARTGEQRARLGAAGEAGVCVLVDRAWTLQQGEIHELALPSLQERTLPAPDLVLDGPCGTRGSNVWLIAHTRPPLDVPVESFLVALDRDSGREVVRIPLDAEDPSWMAFAISRAAADQRDASGALPRFVPHRGRVGTAQTRLSVLDLDQHRVAWATAAREDLAAFDQGVVRLGKHYLLVHSDGSDIALSEISGETGELTAAVDCPGCRLLKIGVDGLWLSTDWDVASVDPTTLVATPFLGKLELNDTLAQTRTFLAPAVTPP
jgi:outer membrane protein assembly factor BamB